MPHSVQPLGKAAIEASPILKKWLETAQDDDDDDDDDNETASKTSGSRRSAAKKTALLHGNPPHPEPIAPRVYPSIQFCEAEALYGPFSRSNDYASQDGPSDSPRDITQDAEMEDPNNRFNDEVLIYYCAALSSPGSDPTFDIVQPTSDSSLVPEPGSEEFAGISARALEALNVDENAREGWFEVTPEVEGEETRIPDGIREDHTHPLTHFLFTGPGDEDLMSLDTEKNAREDWSKVAPEVGRKAGVPDVKLEDPLAPPSWCLFPDSRYDGIYEYRL